VGKGCLSFNTEHVDTQFNDFNTGLDLPQDSVCFILRLKSNDPSTAIALFEEKIEELKTMATAMIPGVDAYLDDIEFKYVTDGDYMKFAVICNIPMLKDLIEQYSGMVD